MRPFTQSKINDRFLLGGATSLRGFGLWGAGPRDQGKNNKRIYIPKPLQLYFFPQVTVWVERRTGLLDSTSSPPFHSHGTSSYRGSESIPSPLPVTSSNAVSGFLALVL